MMGIYVAGGIFGGHLNPAITFPKDNVQPATAVFTEFLATAIFLASILALGDDINDRPEAGMQAFVFGILISALFLGFSCR